MGKGSNRRPQQISSDEMRKRWAEAFPKEPKWHYATVSQIEQATDALNQSISERTETAEEVEKRREKFMPGYKQKLEEWLS